MKAIALSLVFMAATISVNGQATVKDTKGKTLIVYYTRTGNTQAIVDQIKTLTGADTFRVETVKAYPEDYEKTTEVAKEEQNSNARPELKNNIENIDQYDTIFIGFPIWWGTYPMAIATFLDGHDLKGKTVIPFCTHGGGGVDRGFTDVQKSTPAAIHKEGFSISGSRAASSAGNVEKWLRGIGEID